MFMEKTFKQFCEEHIFYFWDILPEHYEKGSTSLKRTRIHPLKQRIVDNIIHTDDIIRNCSKIILFGSSVNQSCHIDSDIDLAIELNDINKAQIVENAVLFHTKGSSDIVWFEQISEKDAIYQKIMKGAVIYEYVD